MGFQYLSEDKMVYKCSVEAQTESNPQAWAGEGTGLAWRESCPRSHPSLLEALFQPHGSCGLLQDFYPCGLAGQGKNNSQWKKR